MQSKVRALDVRIFSHKRKLIPVLLALSLPYFAQCNQELQNKPKLEKIKYTKLFETDTPFKSISLPQTDANDSLNDIFTKDEQFKIVSKKDDLLHNSISAEILNDTSSLQYLTNENIEKQHIKTIENKQFSSSLSSLKPPKNLNTTFNAKRNANEKSPVKESFNSLDEFKEVFLNYVADTVTNESYEILKGFSNDDDDDEKNSTRNKTKHENTSKGLDVILTEKLHENFLETNRNVLNINEPRAVESGRLFFFRGLKKFLWPLFIGVQIAKTILLALFLPSILGSIGKIVGKGISSVSGFNHPAETVSDLDFKDNTYNFDQDNMKYNDYQYPQADASTQHFATQMYDAAAINNNALSRFGIGDQKATFVNTGEGMYSSKNPNPNMMGSQQKNTFQVFHDIPISSMLLTNYDPFYSPLLSRLDSVFQQLGLGSGNEVCREKLICLMYANPAKYAPYSNLVSAQLSRELNELRKPTVDNPEILRFFKYMKAAKDGQDGVNCEESYIDCINFKESENPAMLTTYHDINKLVQARKLDN